MYKALYRKWRPMSFDDVVSQPHITTTLKNQIATNKTAHAYLFTGSRGTGKTTCARIFAKAVNCINPQNGEPCLECENCKNADNGSLTDIIEIDAASNSKVDDIRELREGVVYTPEMCKYKVYIIDEVHMLSTGAFNALLKTMEEPPPHVKFILATTEIHKVPATIVSRCQHFDFHRIKTQDIISRLKYISEQENLTLNDDAASLIAKLSDGGMRDALSLLDQCLAYADDITLDVVSTAAGIAGRDYLFDIIEGIYKRNSAKVIGIIDDLYAMSKDLAVLCSELITQMRNIMIIKSTEKSEDLVICLPDEFERLKKISENTDLDTVLAFISILQGCSERFARSSNKCIELEMCAVKMCTYSPSTGTKAPTNNNESQMSDSQVNNLISRINQLEKLLENGTVTANKQISPLPTKSVPSAPLKKFDPNNFTPLEDWKNILGRINELSPGIGAFLQNSMACIENNTFCVVVNSDFFLQKVKLSNDRDILKKIVSEYYGKDFGFKLYSSKSVDIQDQENPINELIKRAKTAEIKVEIKK